MHGSWRDRPQVVSAALLTSREDPIHLEAVPLAGLSAQLCARMIGGQKAGAERLCDQPVLCQ